MHGQSIMKKIVLGHIHLEEFVFNISAQQKISTDNNLWKDWTQGQIISHVVEICFKIMPTH